MGFVISKLGLCNQQDDQLSSSLLMIPKEKITILRHIGSGNFGVVYEISWKKDICLFTCFHGVKRKYVCKTLHDLNNAHILMKEFYNMAKLKNDNVVKLLGISLDERTMSLVNVYSYGVVLWEMFSYGALPSLMNHSNENPFLEQPEACPDDFYGLMKKCWSFDSHSRPEFGEIKNYLSELKLAILGVSNDYSGEHFQQGDNVIAIRDKGENRFYCQNVKSGQFGEIGRETLYFVADSATENISESSRLIQTGNEAFELEASRSDTSTSFLNRMKWLITLGIIIFCSLLSVIILAIWYTIAMSDVETTTYIVPTEVISTTTQTNVNSKYECPNYIHPVIASEEVTYILDGIYVYKIQNQRVVKKVKEADFFVQSNFSLANIKAGYIRNGSLILLDDMDDKKQVQVFIYDPIPMQSDKFKLREGFPKKTPIDWYISGAIKINDKAYVFDY
uniref:Protein kinase domain-containing protein n=1 Tax=Acrobeloides nanus TaxID=290746 RepID=A0A914EAS5_9BILA